MIHRATPPSSSTSAGVMDMSESQKDSLRSFCRSIRAIPEVGQASSFKLCMTAEVLQVYQLYTSRVKDDKDRDNALAADQSLQLDAEFLDWFFSRLDSLRVELKYSLAPTRSNLSQHLPMNLDVANNIRHLDLRNLPLNLVHGLSNLRQRLESLSLSYCRGVRLHQVMVGCLADKDSGGAWPKLKMLGLSHNQMEGLGSGEQRSDVLFDNHIPNLERIDLSFNRLSHLSGLESLPYLTHLSLGFNDVQIQIEREEMLTGAPSGWKHKTNGEQNKENAGEYLEIKRKIERLRDQHGENWLHSAVADQVQAVLGIEKSESRSAAEVVTDRAEALDKSKAEETSGDGGGGQLGSDDSFEVISKEDDVKEKKKRKEKWRRKRKQLF